MPVIKRLILICGANGVGKSTACKALVDRLPGSAYIDSDYCRYMNPFSFTEEEIGVVVANVATLMANFFRCSTIENVVFQYGFHGVRKRIFGAVLEALSEKGISYRFCPIILECELEENVRRMKSDHRDEARIQRAVQKTRAVYDEYEYPRINITDLSVSETVDEILGLLQTSYGLG